MKRVVSVLVGIFIVCVIPYAVAQPSATDISGSLGSNSNYHIKVPASWNGVLVIWNHGFSLEPPEEVPSLGPLESLQLAEGYAIAASSYRQIGWATFRIQQDLKNLYEVFRRNFGVPAQVIVTGASLGGIVTIQAIEEANIGNVVAGLTVCGALAGSRNWDAALDTRLTYDAVCGGVAGAGIPGGAAGLPKDSTFSPAQLGSAINACFGVPGVPTPDQFARLGLFLSVTQIPPSFIGTDMGYVTFALADLTWDPMKLSGQIGVGNLNVDYGNALVNATIARVVPNPGAQTKLHANYTPTGDTHGAKIVSMHTDKDGLVLVENERVYADLVSPDLFTTAIVIEATPTHCGFTSAETVASWESLRGWLAGGPQPTPTSMQSTCNAVAAGGMAAGPCRIDPAFVIPDPDRRIRPR
jgi:hypothetical protein